MKSLYKSPVVTVEELTKVDVLCASSEVNTDASTLTSKDNINQMAKTLADFSSFL
jgi:hypothetical protein